MIRLKTRNELQAWLANPTTEKPILLEYFYEWFFKNLDAGKWDECIADLSLMVDFCRICEKKTLVEARIIVKVNTFYLSGRAARWRDATERLFSQIPWSKNL